MLTSNCHNLQKEYIVILFWYLRVYLILKLQAAILQHLDFVQQYSVLIILSLRSNKTQLLCLRLTNRPFQGSPCPIFKAFTAFAAFTAFTAFTAFNASSLKMENRDEIDDCVVVCQMGFHGNSLSFAALLE